MSRFFPHAEYAEDQPLAYIILTTHVLTRGATTGAIIGAASFAAAAAAPSSLSTPNRGLFLQAAGRGTTIGTALLAVALVGRMWGREDIEWKDRSWRLLHNKGQVECDDWTYGGAVAGVGAAAVGGMLRGAGWRGVVGAGGLGSVPGTVGYMGWRYGVKGGKFEE
ncbi:hypothetical protein M406DRAFT_249066 [Cryphonectria parasitica EP155]|uniref:Uncharacterized protein n=1 Tax=Cryphonectria parasitica (strain ATCC 38755 / EP155) TaxID=660469 RepID=A0A9P5CUP4_CRYP1|nr:uncharacterized protein M406DRAFT_249066 [Cryphonectria parasitica EP155]KAF3770822.1 hypothetical protein M406DRAFT_249066 [Cryphonectria parasitica EP155]